MEQCEDFTRFFFEVFEVFVVQFLDLTRQLLKPVLQSPVS